MPHCPRPAMAFLLGLASTVPAMATAGEIGFSGFVAAGPLSSPAYSAVSFTDKVAFRVVLANAARAPATARIVATPLPSGRPQALGSLTLAAGARHPDLVVLPLAGERARWRICVHLSGPRTAPKTACHIYSARRAG